MKVSEKYIASEINGDGKLLVNEIIENKVKDITSSINFNFLILESFSSIEIGILIKLKINNYYFLFIVKEITSSVNITATFLDCDKNEDNLMYVDLLKPIPTSLNFTKLKSFFEDQPLYKDFLDLKKQLDESTFLKNIDTNK